MRKEFRTSGNYDDFNKGKKIKKGESFDLESEPSLTIPDQALTIQEILERYTRGGEVRVLKPQYLEDAQTDVGSMVPDMSKMDKLDKIDMAREVGEYIDTVQKAVKKRKASKKEELKGEKPSSDDPIYK